MSEVDDEFILISSKWQDHLQLEYAKLQQKNFERYIDAFVQLWIKKGD